MGITIYKPAPKKQGPVSVGMIGSLVGSLAGPGGAAVGGAIGGQVDKQQTEAGQPGPQLPVADNAMQRRQEMAQQQQQLLHLEQGIQTLPTMPPEQRAQYEPQLLDAYSYLKSQNKGYA